MPISQAPMYNTSFFYAEYVGKRYVCKVPADLSFDEVLKPAFWTHVGQMLKPWDRIEVRPEDLAYVAELVVVDAGPMFAKVALLSKQALEVKSEAAGALEIEFAAGKHRVRRGSDVLKDGFATKKDAQRWVDDYLSAKAA
jgi:hypothetical protein